MYQNLILGLLAPYRTPYAETFYVCSKYLTRSNSLLNFSVISLCILQLWEYVFPVGFPLYGPKNGIVGGFDGEDVKILCSNPRKALPCVNKRMMVYRRQNRFNSLSSRSVQRFCVQRNLKKLSGNFGYMRRSNPWGDLDQMRLVVRYRGHNHVCNIWWLSIKGCGCGERGKFAFSHWLDASPLQHWSHYCGHRVIYLSLTMRSTVFCL